MDRTVIFDLPTWGGDQKIHTQDVIFGPKLMPHVVRSAKIALKRKHFNKSRLKAKNQEKYRFKKIPFYNIWKKSDNTGHSGPTKTWIDFSSYCVTRNSFPNSLKFNTPHILKCVLIGIIVPVQKHCYNLFVTSTNETTNSPINLLKLLFYGVLFLFYYVVI